MAVLHIGFMIIQYTTSLLKDFNGDNLLSLQQPEAASHRQTRRYA